MSISRTSRLSEEIKRVVSNVIQNELKDPRVSTLTSVTHVDVTRDLSYAKIFISVFGTDDEKMQCLQGLKSAAGYVRKEVGNRIKIRHIPEIIFELDNSIEYGLHIEKLLQDIGKNNDSNTDR